MLSLAGNPLQLTNHYREIVKQRFQDLRILDGTPAFNELEENAKKKDDGKLDMLNLYVRELREPRHQHVPEERKSQSPRPCVDYTRTYLPNGKQVSKKTYEEQLPGVNKLFIEDWRRVGFQY